MIMINISKKISNYLNIFLFIYFKILKTVFLLKMFYYILNKILIILNISFQ